MIMGGRVNDPEKNDASKDTLSFSESFPFSKASCVNRFVGGVYHHLANPSNYPTRKLTVRT